MKLKTPLSREDVTKLNAGDNVELSGIIVTARDVAHKFLTENEIEKSEIDLEGTVIYHCGPVIQNDTVIAAGPTTSIREEAYESDVIKKYGVRGIIGKGGMGEKTQKALTEEGAVYFSAVGGAAVVIADSIKRIVDVKKLGEFGSPEAFWFLEVEDMPLIVGMDSHGKSLYKDVEESSKVKLDKLLEL